MLKGKESSGGPRTTGEAVFSGVYRPHEPPHPWLFRNLFFLRKASSLTQFWGNNHNGRKQDGKEKVIHSQ